MATRRSFLKCWSDHSSSCVKSSSYTSYALRIKWPLLRVVRLVLLPWLLSHGSKELKWKTSYSSSRQDLLGMQQATHSRGMRADHPLQEWPYPILASLFLYPLFPPLSRFLGPDWLCPLQIGDCTNVCLIGYTQDQLGRRVCLPARGSHLGPWLPLLAGFFFFPSGFLFGPSSSALLDPVSLF